MIEVSASFSGMRAIKLGLVVMFHAWSVGSVVGNMGGVPA